MTETEAKRLGLKISPLDKTDQIPNQADGKCPLDTVGVVKGVFIRDSMKLYFHGYVIKHLSQPILFGLPFISRNNIVQFINKNLMIAKDPPFYPGSNLPFNIMEVANCSNVLLSQIEIGDKVPKGIKDRLNSIHSHHKQVFDGNLSLGYNRESGNFDVDFDFNNDMPPPPHKGSSPAYYKHADEAVLHAKIEELEKQNIVAKASDLRINIKYSSPCMLAKKSSARNISKDDYNNLPIHEKTKLNRFVLCLNKLCNYVNKKPAASAKIGDTINMVGSFQFVITADLTDSFNQRKIRERRLPYMGFHSPFGDNYVFLRSPQGLINQSEELEILVKVVLLIGVKEGWCRVHADNIYVLGYSYSETVDRWKQVLELLEKNNLKSIDSIDS